MRIAVLPDGTISSLTIDNGTDGRAPPAVIDTARGGWRIQVNLDELTKHAEAALYRVLVEIEGGRALLAIQDGDRAQDILCASISVAIATLEAEISQRQERLSPRFTRRQSAFRDVWAMQLLSQGQRREVAELVAFANAHLGGRYMIVRAAPDNVMQVEAVGEGYVGLDENWARSQAPRPIRELPDLRYGAWLDDGYRQILAQGNPQREVVDAVVFHPRRGRHRYAYRRLVLPFTDPAGSSYLFSTSVLETASGQRATE